MRVCTAPSVNRSTCIVMNGEELSSVEAGKLGEQCNIEPY